MIGFQDHGCEHEWRKAEYEDLLLLTRSSWTGPNSHRGPKACIQRRTPPNLPDFEKGLRLLD